MAVYFFYGAEDFNIDIELNKMRSKLNPDFLSMSYRVYDNPDYEEMITALRSSPMMFGSSLIVIDIFKYFFEAKNEGESKFVLTDAALDDIKDSLKNNQDGVDIVFVVRVPADDGKKIDSRRKLFKILSEFNAKEFQPFSPFKTAEIAGWIKNRAKEKQLKIDDEAVNMLIEQIGTNLRQFDGELEKLKLVAYPENLITKKMVTDNCITNQDLFNITNYLMKNDKGKAVAEYKQLLDKKHPLEITSALLTMIRQWIIVKSKTSISEIMSLTGIKSDYRISKLKDDLKSLSLRDLVQLKENLFAAEYRIKAGKSLDIESEVEIALIR